jgi:hypothetical protein
LSNLKQCATNLIPIADAYGIVRQAFDCEVFAELPINDLAPLQLLLPIAMRFDLVYEDGALLTSVPGQVTLAVSVEIQPPDATTTTHRILPNPGVHSAPFPRDVARKAYVYR